MTPFAPHLGMMMAVALRALAIPVLSLAACQREQPAIRASLSLSEALATGDTAGYRRVTGPRPFAFPADHGPHPGFRVEWWYFTGNLESDLGRRFGFQLTFFRSAQTPDPLPRTSAWAATDVWMAHLALTDADGERFHAYERLARGAAGLAGARAEPFRVWLEDWEVRSVSSTETFPVRLHAAAGDVAINLELQRGKPIVVQGDGGFSAKGAERGDASHYYSLTRMPAQGKLVLSNVQHDVSGNAWLDREWSTSGLGANLVGWDWLAVQLDDGRDLMLYRLRRRDGTADPFSAGTLVSGSGETTPLAAHDFVLEAVGEWRSPIDGTTYPRSWRARVPSSGLDITITPVLPAQELNLTVRYWEGAVDVSGSVTGRGYLEMTGYAGPPGERTGPAGRYGSPAFNAF